MTPSPEPPAVAYRRLIAAGFWLALVVALLLRLPLLSFQSGDFATFTGRWYDILARQGGGELLRSGAANYTPFYLYGLIAIHALFPGLAPVVAIKLVELPFDFLGAALVGAIVRRVRGDGQLAGWATLAVLYLPTVVLNGAFWGQVDMVWTCAILGALYALIDDRPALAMVCFGLGFAFKLQTIFAVPLLALVWLRRGYSPLLCGLPLLVYVLSILPAWWAGRSLSDLLTIYAAQADFYPRLSSNAANVFQLIPNNHYGSFRVAATLWAAGVLGTLTLAELRLPGPLTARRVLHLALLSVLLVPYLLPKMHDRYFFAADVLALALACVRPRHAPVAAAIVTVSLLSYGPFLLGVEHVPLAVLVLVQGVSAWLLLRDYVASAGDEAN